MPAAAIAEAPAVPRWRELIRAHLAGEAVDAREVAAAVLREMRAQELREFAADYMARAVVDEISRSRRDLLRSGANGRRAGRSRWGRVLDEKIGSEHIRIGSMTAADCDRVAAEYGQRAEANAAMERAMVRLAKMLRTAGAATLDDLGAEAVAEVLPHA
jgi:hypothetical protein